GNVSGQWTHANVPATTPATDAALTNPDPDWNHAWFSILPVTPLPSITESVIINGYSQTGSTANTNAVTLGLNNVLRIELTGGGADANGLTFNTGSSTVQGLVINNFGGNNGSGILFFSAGNLAAGNYLGTDVSGTLDRGNQQGVRMIGASAGGNTVGGLTPSDRNLISGNNLSGVSILAGPANVVLGNLIGTDRSGTRDRGNNEGVTVAAGNNSGGNSIAGTAALGNTGLGIQIDGGGAPNARIGGTTAGAGNLVSGNGTIGIWFNVPSAGARVEGNLVGTDITGTLDLGNGTDGIQAGAAG